MNENDRTTLEQAIYEEMELTPEMIRSIRTLCGVCLCSFVNPRRSKSPSVQSKAGIVRQSFFKTMWEIFTRPRLSWPH